MVADCDEEAPADAGIQDGVADCVACGVVGIVMDGAMGCVNVPISTGNVCAAGAVP